MEKYKLVSIGAMALEGLEHGNYTTKCLERDKIWRGDIPIGNKQLFRVLRCHSSPSIRRITKRSNIPEKVFTCSSCKQKGHRKNSKACSNAAYRTHEVDEPDDKVHVEEVSDEDDELHQELINLVPGPSGLEDRVNVSVDPRDATESTDSEEDSANVPVRSNVPTCISTWYCECENCRI